MNAPQMVTPEELDKLLTDYIKGRTVPDGFGGSRCIHCDLPIRYATGHFSVHLEVFGTQCAGPGIVTTRTLPYCIQCEGEPEMLGCIHVTKQEYEVYVFRRHTSG